MSSSSDQPPGARRPILRLKLGSQPKPQPVVEAQWRCKPCGGAVAIPDATPDEESVRCPACNARLGLAGDFRSQPPALERLRARLRT
jgi:hypothetical protein